MENFLLYIGKSALAAGAFYLVYLALFQNQKQFTFNRIYLPVSLALSFAIPLITFTTVNYVEPVPVESNPVPVLTESFEPVVMQQSESKFIWEWYHYLFAIYAAGTFLFLFRLLLGHGKAWNIIRKSRVQELFNNLVNISKKDIHPFSFFSKIVLSENTLSHPHLEMIVAHEKIHVKEKHTLDILFTEILFLLQWFNPFAWLLKDAVKNNLEYKTDHEIAKTTDPQTYQLAMLALADKQGVAPFLTALNGSQLKSRIIMMKKKSGNKYAWLKQLVVLPLLALLVMGLAEREVRTEFVNPNKKIEIFVNGKEISTNHAYLKDIDFLEPIDPKEIIKALNLKDVKATRLEDSANDSKLYIRTGDYLPENMKLEVYLNGEKIPSKNANLKKLDLTQPINRNDIINALNIDDVLVTSMQNNIDGYSFYLKTKDYKPGENKEKAIPHLSLSNILRSLSNITFSIKKTSNEKAQKERVEEYLFDFSQLKIVVDGKVIPTDSPELKNIKVTKENLHNSKYVTEIVDALNIDLDDIKASKSSNNPNDPFVYIRTKNYVPDTNREFEEILELDEYIKEKINSQNDSLKITGLNSMGNNRPLIAINGVPQFRVSQNFGITSADKEDISKLINIPSQDIQSIDVLKDDASTKVYGPQGREGVVNIKTKSGSAQDAPAFPESNTGEPVYVKVEDMPEFPGGEIALRKYIANSINYPKKAVEEQVQGTVYVSFIIEKTGKVTNPEIAKGVDAALNKEAFRVIRFLPRWKPGKQDGKPVNVQNTVPVEFSLEQSKVGLDGKLLKNGVQLRNHDNPSKRPLFIIDGIEKENMDDLHPEDIRSINVLKDKAVEKYGEKAKHGAVIVTTKNNKESKTVLKEKDEISAQLEPFEIKSPLDLRKFLTQEINYPLEALKGGLEGGTVFYFRVDKKGNVYDVAQAHVPDKMLKQIVVTGNKPEKISSENTNKRILFEEVRNVAKLIPKIEDPELQEKTIGINVKFVLQ